MNFTLMFFYSLCTTLSSLFTVIIGNGFIKLLLIKNSFIATRVVNFRMRDTVVILIIFQKSCL